MVMERAEGGTKHSGREKEAARLTAAEHEGTVRARLQWHQSCLSLADADPQCAQRSCDKPQFGRSSTACRNHPNRSISLPLYLTGSLSHCLSATLPLYLIASLHFYQHCLSISLPHCRFISLPRCISTNTASLSRCLSATLPVYLIASLHFYHHCLSISLPLFRSHLLRAFRALCCQVTLVAAILHQADRIRRSFAESFRHNVRHVSCPLIRCNRPARTASSVWK